MNSQLSSKTSRSSIIAISTLVISIIIIAISLLTSFSLYKNNQDLDKSWIIYKNQNSIKNQLAIELNYIFIKQGLVNNIKHYALLPNNKSETNITEVLSYVEEIIKKYKRINDLSAIEARNLLIIKHELGLVKNAFFLIKKFSYQNELERYKNIPQKLSNKEIEDAINALLQFNIAQDNIYNKKIEKTLSQMFWLIIATLIIIPLVSFFTISYWRSRHHVTTDILASHNRNELNKFFRYTAVPTVIVNRSGDIVSANSAACDLTGYSMSHLRSKHLEQLIVKAPVSLLKKIMTLSTPEKSDDLLKLLTNKEKEINVQIDITQMREGSSLLSIVSFRDIDNEQRKIKQCYDNEEMYNFTEKSNRIGSWRWDFSDDNLTWSPAMYDIYGFTKEQITISQELIFSRIPSNVREDVSNAINESVIFGSELDIKHDIRHRNGQFIKIQQQGRIIKDESGKSLYMLGTVKLIK